MHCFQHQAALRLAVTGWRGLHQKVALVPTMGNLHAGHLSLVRAAAAAADRVVVSIFVNPTQFGPNEDLARYPRTPERDVELLQSVGADAVFLPTVEEIYPYGLRHCVQVMVPGLSDVLCGQFRPGHFAGVATVVLRLFNMVQPDLALFGRKDLQQLEVIRYLVKDLALPIDVLGLPTCRDSDGLALSSRNQYLDAEQRPRAAQLHAGLRRMLQRAAAGDDPAAVEVAARVELEQQGFVIDYVVLRREGRLAEEVTAGDDRAALVALAAARLGSTRLIDNLAMSEWSQG